MVLSICLEIVFHDLSNVQPFVDRLSDAFRTIGFEVIRVGGGTLVAGKDDTVVYTRIKEVSLRESSIFRLSVDRLLRLMVRAESTNGRELVTVTKLLTDLARTMEGVRIEIC